MGSADPYYLGYSAAETQRLQRQAAELADDSAWLFDQLEPLGGARVLEIGCGPQGCLDVLSERVGPSGSVLGVERSEEAVILARGLAAERELSNVEVICGDARHTSLPRQSFDVVTARLVLVNIPEPEEVLAEAIALLREINLGATAIGTGLNTDPRYADSVRSHLSDIVDLELVTAPINRN